MIRPTTLTIYPLMIPADRDDGRPRRGAQHRDAGRRETGTAYILQEYITFRWLERMVGNHRNHYNYLVFQETEQADRLKLEKDNADLAVSCVRNADFYIHTGCYFLGGYLG